MKDSSQITVTSASESLLISNTVPTQRFVEITATAPSAPNRSERAPINIAIVIDRSGSMSGDKLTYVKQAACHVLDQLDERDRVAVVGYDNEVDLLQTSVSVSAQQRESIKQKINALYARGSTDLGGGWLRGGGEVAASLMSGGVNRILLMTDGLANQGITDTKELVHHAREMNQRGVSTSTLGVGLDFDEHLLEPMATEGGGHYYFIEHPNQIAEMFRQELGDLLSVIAHEAVLEVAIPSGVSVELLGGLPNHKSDAKLDVPIGDLCADQERSFYLRVLTSPGQIGEKITLAITLRYADDASKAVTVATTLAFEYATDATMTATARDMELAQRAAEVDIAAAEAEALKMEKEGRGQEAYSYMMSAVAASAPAMPPARMAELQESAEELESGLSPLIRKVRQTAAYAKRLSRK